MEVVNLIKEYWVLITFLMGVMSAFLVFIKAMIEAVRCSLRNDILDIFDRCKKDKTITHYQLEAIKHSSEIYFKLKGNSFVEDVVERCSKFELID